LIICHSRAFSFICWRWRHIWWTRKWLTCFRLHSISTAIITQKFIDKIGLIFIIAKWPFQIKGKIETRSCHIFFKPLVSISSRFIYYSLIDLLKHWHIYSLLPYNKENTLLLKLSNKSKILLREYFPFVEATISCNSCSII